MRGQITFFIITLQTLLQGRSNAKLSSKYSAQKIGKSEIIVSKSSTIFPLPSFVNDFVIFSDTIYSTHSCKSFDSVQSIATCDTYIKMRDGVHAAIVYSEESRYVSVVFRGTWSIYDATRDTEIAMTPFGPKGLPIVSPEVQVHDGFNKDVFNGGVFDKINAAVTSLLEKYPRYRLILTGHSLGAAESVIVGAALAHAMPRRQVDVFNIGCPRTGNLAWKLFVDGLHNLSVWRFVFRDDPIPRSPLSLRFKHVGHTFQFYRHYSNVYYLHQGDGSTYAGVPFNWDMSSFEDPISLAKHSTYYYLKYMEKSLKDPDKYFSNSFVEIKSVSDYNDTDAYENREHVMQIT